LIRRLTQPVGTGVVVPVGVAVAVGVAAGLLVGGTVAVGVIVGVIAPSRMPAISAIVARAVRAIRTA
jgi:hypothetical protein